MKKSSTLKFIMNISFLTSICIHRFIVLIFIGGKSMLIGFFQRKIFFPTILNFHFRQNRHFRAKTGKYQTIRSKLETKEQSNKMLIYWSVPDCLVTPGTEKPDPTH